MINIASCAWGHSQWVYLGFFCDAFFLKTSVDLWSTHWKQLKYVYSCWYGKKKKLYILIIVECSVTREMCPMFFTAFLDQLMLHVVTSCKASLKKERFLENICVDRWMESLFVKRSGNYTCSDWKRCRKKDTHQVIL